jgi:hypothetical protein
MELIGHDSPAISQHSRMSVLKRSGRLRRRYRKYWIAEEGVRGVAWSGIKQNLSSAF